MKSKQKETYSVGEPLNPKKTDPDFTDREKAEAAALEFCFDENIPDAIWAVRSSETGEIVSLIGEGIIFRPY